MGNAKGVDTLVIRGKADLVAYVRVYHRDFVRVGLCDALADALMLGGHPGYGEDWAPWLGLADDLTGPASVAWRQGRDVEDIRDAVVAMHPELPARTQRALWLGGSR